MGTEADALADEHCPAPPPVAEGFEGFFRAHYAGIVGIAHGVLGDRHAAEDVAQEVFIAAEQRFPDAGAAAVAGHAAAWVRVAAVHTALNVVRGSRRRDRRQLRAGSAGAGAAAGPEEIVLDRAARAEVRAALSRLPRRAATVLLLRHSGLSYAEVADAMGVGIGQVGTMLRRAEASLRKEMEHGARR